MPEYNNCCLYYLNRHYLLVAWFAVNAVIFSRSCYYYMTRPDYYYLRGMLGYGLGVSRGSAAVINLSCALVLLPVCRTLNSTIHQVLGGYSRYLLTCWFTRLKSIHITIAITILVASLVHSCGHIANAVNYSNHYSAVYPEMNWASFKGQSPAILILTSVVGVTGIMMLFVLILMVFLSTRYIRQLDYDLFWGSHFLFIIFLLLYLIHPLKGVLKRQINIYSHTPGCSENITRGATQIPLLMKKNITEFGFLKNYGYSYNRISNISNASNKNYSIVQNDSHSNYSDYNIIANNLVICDDPPSFGDIKTQAWLWLAGSLLIYIIDIAVRIRSRNYSNMFIVESAKLLPGDVMDIKIRSLYVNPKSSLPNSCIVSDNYTLPSQYVLIQCPHLSPLEWHPFTIVNMYVDLQGRHVITLLIKIKGDWTRSIYNSSVVAANKNNNYYSVHKPLRLLVDGPFFSPIQNVVNSDVAICIAAGIGVTPFASILHHVVKEDVNIMCQPFRVHLVWVIRTLEQVVWIQKVLLKLYAKLSNQNQLDRFDIRLFMTRSFGSEDIEDDRFSRICSMENVTLYCGRRPDWTSLLSTWQQYYERGTVRVFLCGPPPLIKDVRNTCNKLNRSKTGCHLKCIIESFS